MGFPESRIRAPALGRRQRAAASAGLREVSKTPREGRRHKLPDVGNFFAKSRLIERLVNTKNYYISEAQNLRPRPIFPCQKDCRPFASIAATGSGSAASCVAASVRVRASRPARAKAGSRDVATSRLSGGPPISRPIESVLILTCSWLRWMRRKRKR
jgi:hypothetical protein